MNRSSLVRARYANRAQFVATRGAYLFFCGAVVFTVALLTIAGFFLPPRAVQSVEPAAIEPIPVAKIQLNQNEKGLCRQLTFHNDSGRFDEGGFAPCRGLIPAELLVDTVRGQRNEAISKVFKIR
jgi:hypothetical protein